MKLLVDTKAERVLYAEAGKDVVDFLFSFLALPIATVVKLLGKESMVGCVGNVYASVEALDDTYVEPGAAKNALIRPTVPSAAVGTKGSLFCLPAPPTPVDQQPLPKRFFRCSGRYSPPSSFGGGYGVIRSSSCEGDYLTDTCDAKCPTCSDYLNKEMSFLPAVGSRQSVEAKATATGNNKNGLVRSVVTYTVMDDLKVAPMSTISGITLINTFGITDISMLKEKTVQIGYEEGLEILRLSLQSKTVLTNVFLGKKVHKARSDSDMWWKEV
ncbi:uncharacterized protein LOC8075140 [Sorghum bicolor]|uniref:DUF674 domain-containing protein n=1 Tax=Sorghum bicolor TaxID=4558 RepID=A0A1B6Q1N3_SORBI|nr:uncharacterized protein LOC8075140 [Sorghum bicolor]KXG31839.1 hypothetical protein SORBI_3003G065900 [Sorghum bicolor]|eukprot:XP_002455180.2 uncharacterized protein LOC8075140 [Sorghum bicolor]